VTYLKAIRSTTALVLPQKQKRIECLHLCSKTHILSLKICIFNTDFHSCRLSAVSLSLIISFCIVFVLSAINIVSSICLQSVKSRGDFTSNDKQFSFLNFFIYFFHYQDNIPRTIFPRVQMRVMPGVRVKVKVRVRVMVRCRVRVRVGLRVRVRVSFSFSLGSGRYCPGSYNCPRLFLSLYSYVISYHIWQKLRNNPQF